MHLFRPPSLNQQLCFVQLQNKGHIPRFLQEVATILSYFVDSHFISFFFSCGSETIRCQTTA